VGDEIMIRPGRTCHTESCTVEVPEALEKEGLCLDHYLEEAFHKLAVATEDIQRGENIGSQTLEWLLAQVDFAVDCLSREDSIVDPEQRSKLLELLLGVANLNEHLRHSAVLAQPLH
jgi:hypothetical protein